MIVAVVTDGAAAIPADLVAARHLGVVPMLLSVAGVPVREGDRALGELLSVGGVTTSAPTPGDFDAEICARLASGADAVLVLTIASTMSASYQSAIVAARGHGAARVRVLDTATAAGAQALVVLAAAEAAARGATLDEVEAAAARVARRVRLVATVAGFEYLVRSGRVPGIAGWAGRALGISPLFEFRAGKVRRLRPARGVDAALDRIVTRFHRSAEPGARPHVVALHAVAPDAAAALLARAVAGLDPVDPFVGEFDAAMVVNTGPGVLGLAWWWETATPEV